MSFVKRLWKDRVSQYPNRRAIYDGSFSKSVTVSRDEGIVTEAGDPYNAANMNDLEDRIEAGLAEKPDREEVEDMVEGFFPLDELSGTVAVFNPGVMLPLRSCECKINAYQTGSGDPAPDNIRAINGFNACTVSVVGKNLFDNSAVRRGVYTNWNGSTNTGNVEQNFSSAFIKVKPNTTYSIKLFGQSYLAGSLNVIYFDNARQGINQGSTLTNLTSDVAKTFTTHANAEYAVLTGYRSGANGGTDIFLTAKLLVCEGSDVTNYEAFIGTKNVADWGINQWNEEWESGSIDISTGQDIVNNTRIRSVGYIKATPNTSYYCFKKSGFANLRVHYYTSDKTWVSVSSSIGSNTTITTPANCYYIRFAVDGTTYNNDTSINFPATFTGYYPYIPNNPGVVYSGKINVTTGELILDKKVITLTGQEATGNVGWDGYYITDTTFSGDNSRVMTSMCSHTNNNITGSQFYNSVGTANYPNACSISQGSIIRFRNRACGSTLAEYKTYLQTQYSNGTPVQILGILATPLVYNLDPVQIKTLFGLNNIYQDCNGNIDIIFHKEIAAKNISFDNSGTTLTATNVEDAIKEVLGRI